MHRLRRSLGCCCPAPPELLQAQDQAQGQAQAQDAHAPPASHWLYGSSQNFTLSVIEGELLSGNVALLKGTWLLARAGFVEEEATVRRRVGGEWQHDGLRMAGGRWEEGTVKKWVQRHEAKPLPSRVIIERDHPEAFLTLEEFRALQAAYLQRVACTRNVHGMLDPEHGEALPVVSASHCWETPHDPDPQGRTLVRLAGGLAGAWDAEDEDVPVSGLPLYQDWGYADVGVFFDFASLYQNKPTRRTAEQEAKFKGALANMSMWYAYQLVTVYIIRGQDPFLKQYRKDETTGALTPTDVPNPRDGRGWPFFEESISQVFKKAPITTWCDVCPPKGVGGGPDVRSPVGRSRPLWNKVVTLGGAGRQSPPLPPSQFGTELGRRAFTNGSDKSVVCSLYEKALRDGFERMSTLRYPNLGWGDAEVGALMATLSEVPCSSVIEIDLEESTMTSLDALGDLLDAGKLRGLQIINLYACRALTSLPAAFGRLPHLKELYIMRCTSLTTLPDSFRHLPADCMVNIWECDGLTSLPDLSSRPELTIEAVPESLAGWEAGGRRAFARTEAGESSPEWWVRI